MVGPEGTEGRAAHLQMLEADAQAALVGRGELVLRQRRLGADVEAARRAGPALRTQGVSGERGEGTAHGLCTEAHPNQRGPVLTVGHTLAMGHPDRWPILNVFATLTMGPS